MSTRIALRQFTARTLAVATAALLLCWPALWNRLPLLFPDDMAYLSDGHWIIAMMQGRWLPMFAPGRSEFYSIGLYLVDGGLVNGGPVDGGTSLWPIVALQAILTAWVLWLVVRSLARVHPITVFLAVTAALCLLTSVAWYVSFVMPDILGSVLYLCLYLLVFARSSLSWWEACGVAIVACWSITAHGSHLLVTTSLLCVLAALWLVRSTSMRGRGFGLLAAVGVLLVAAGSQTLLHQREHQGLSLFGAHPPFLTARLLADGPARTYLQQHCATLSWTLCSHVANLPITDDAFLWQPNSIWSTANLQQKAQLRAEEMPLLLATLRTYPLQQALQSSKNFLDTLVNLGPQDFVNFPFFATRAADDMLPRLSENYQRTRQAHNAMPQAFFRCVQAPVIVLSLLLILWRLPKTLRNRDVYLNLNLNLNLNDRLIGLSLVVLFAVIMNAFVTGVLSGQAPRYQDRVVWLLPLLAALLVGHSWSARKEIVR
jgi:hypothetical protein